jgi:hypothetical protein
MSVTLRSSEIEQARQDVEYLSRRAMAWVTHQGSELHKSELDIQRCRERLLALVESMKVERKDPDVIGSNPCSEIFLEDTYPRGELK